MSVPTLVLHARKDAAVPFEEGKALAAGIPGARFVDLNSANHILLRDEPAFAEFLQRGQVLHAVDRASNRIGASFRRLLRPPTISTLAALFSNGRNNTPSNANG